MTNITRDEIMDRRRQQRLADHFHLFDPAKPSVQFVVVAVDVDGRGGYAESAVGKQLVRFDVNGRARTRQDGLRVRITVMEDTGDAAGTLSSTGKSWPGHQVPIPALDKGAEAARTLNDQLLVQLPIRRLDSLTL